MAASCSENMWGSWSCKPCGKYGGTQINTNPNMTLEQAENRCNSASISVPNSNPYPTNKVNRKDKFKTRKNMNHSNLFSASTKDMESRTKFNNVNFSSFRGSRGNNFNFDGYQSRDANCNMFNQRNMFEYMNGYNGFSGQAPNSFMGTDRNFTYARGVSSGVTPAARQGGIKPPRSYTYPTIGETYLDRQIGGGCSEERCGSAFIKGCPRCGCSDKARGTCSVGGGGAGSGARGYSNDEIAEDILRSGKQVPRNFFDKYPAKGRPTSNGGVIGGGRNIAYNKCRGGCAPDLGVYCAEGCDCLNKRCVGYVPDERAVANPDEFECDEFFCGSFRGGGRQRCPKRCKCKNGICAAKKGGRVTQSNPLSANFTGVNRVFPEGRGNYFSGRDMSNGGFRLR